MVQLASEPAVLHRESPGKALVHGRRKRDKRRCGCVRKRCGGRIRLESDLLTCGELFNCWRWVHSCPLCQPVYPDDSDDPVNWIHSGKYAFVVESRRSPYRGSRIQLRRTGRHDRRHLRAGFDMCIKILGDNELVFGPPTLSIIPMFYKRHYVVRFRARRDTRPATFTLEVWDEATGATRSRSIRTQSR